MSVNDFWSSFGESGSITLDSSCSDTGSIAEEVLRSVGINISNNGGGGLDGLDIKRMSAIQAIKLSLLDDSAKTGSIKELIIDEDGSARFVTVGGAGGLSGGSIYYEIQSDSYQQRCGGVMVIGRKPLAERLPVEWKPIWGNGYKEIFDTGKMMNNCVKDGFTQHATIVFNDPQLDSKFEDGIDNLFDINDPWVSIIGYAHYIDHEGDDDTTITLQNSAKILVKLDSNKLGSLFRRPQITTGDGIIESCYDGMEEEPPSGGGISVPIPSDFRFTNVRGTTVDKFQGVIGVYVIGFEVYSFRGVPPDDAEASNPTPQMGSAEVWGSILDTYRSIKKLEEGMHYVVAPKDGDNVEIIFADNSRVTDPIGIDGNVETTMFLDPECPFAIANRKLSITGFILPTAPLKGFFVQEIHVAMSLDTPSIEVYHPDGFNKQALTIAEGLQFMMGALMIREEPNPIAFNGAILDQAAGIKDHDPTTKQNFTDTPVERAHDQMGGLGTTITISCLDESECARLSNVLYNHLNSGSGVTSTYICGPDTTAELCGRAPNGGVIDSIVYSYQDSSSYTISVSSGPIISGDFAQIDGGPSLRATEEVSGTGTIIEDAGNHIHYKVRIDGIGDRIAVNMCPAVLRVGDVVSCSIHNNPVEA